MSGTNSGSDLWISFLKLAAILAFAFSWLYFFNVHRRYQDAQVELQQMKKLEPPKPISRRELEYARERIFWTRSDWEQAWRYPYHGAVLSILLWLLASTRQRYLRRQLDSIPDETQLR